VGVRHFTELRAWQLADRLRTEVYRFTSVPPAVHDRRFCADIRASSTSVCANIAEGFGRYTHREFAGFLTIARGSLSETQDHLINARDRRYLTPEKSAKLWGVSEDAMRAVTGLFTYLRTHPRPSGQTDASRSTPPT
jgi:four helix bundle protein